MKKKVISCLLAAVMAASMAACGAQESAEQGENNSGTSGTSAQGSSSETAGDSTEAETPAADTLIVGFDSAFPPMGFVGDDGEYTGFDLDLAAAVADRLGMGIEYKPIDWNSKDMELDSGTINCIWNGFTMTGREDDYEWSDPYMKNEQIFVVRGDSEYTSAADLEGKVINVQMDSSAQHALDENQELASTFAEIRPVADYLTCLMELESGAVEAVAMDEVFASYYITQNDKDFRILDDVIAEEEYGVGFKKGNTQLRDQVNDTLKEMAKDGTLAEISEKWFGEDLTIIEA